jgi:phospholipase/lecithinase/hemolysin
MTISATGTTVLTGTGTLTINGAVDTATAGRYNFGDGVHPGLRGHAVMGAMTGSAPVALFTW